MSSFSILCLIFIYDIERAFLLTHDGYVYCIKSKLGLPASLPDAADAQKTLVCGPGNWAAENKVSICISPAAGRRLSVRKEVIPG